MPPCAAAVIAVKPDGVAGAVREAVAAGAERILSIAAGYRYLKVDYDADFDFDTEVYGPIAGLRITL